LLLLLLLLLRWARSASRLLLLLRTLPVALPLLLRTLRPSAAFLFAPRLAGAGTLLMLADLLLHESARLLIEFRAELVVTAVGTALPTFGVGPFTTGAEDGFRERHR
jgi:hypothetical protein